MNPLPITAVADKVNYIILTNDMIKNNKYKSNKYT